MTFGPEQAVSEERREQRRSGVLWILVSLVLAITLGVAYRTDDRADKQATQIHTLQGQVEINGQIANGGKAAAEEANRRLAAAGKPTVAVPTASPVAPTTAPTSGLNLDDVRAVVAIELANHKVTLTEAEVSQIARVAASLIPKPKDGVTPTAAQLQPLVTATVAAYCTSDRCVGKQGPTGPAGGEGRQGPDGKDAPAVTDEQLYAQAQKALMAYCSLDSKPCQGPTGPTGPTGPEGPQGPAGKDAVSIDDTDCVGTGADSYWRIHYSDGTTGTSLGPCRIDVAPTSAPPT